jgi:FkbM family methyltransferase
VSANTDLIFDVGMHQGEDSAFYLAKGFRVVGVEAMATFCDSVTHKFLDEVACEQLTVVNAAIAEEAGPVTFFVNPLSVWGTIRPEWAARNERLGTGPSTPTTVPGIRFVDLVERFGVPHFMKIDIEGADMLCLDGLSGAGMVPDYLSIESDKISLDGLRHEFDVLGQLGYQRFKVVPQHKVAHQVPPSPPREGRYVDWKFHEGSSGLFGEEAPGKWLTRAQALQHYRRIFARYRALGDAGPLRHGPLQPVAKALGRLAGGPWWYDTHAGLGSP